MESVIIIASKLILLQVETNAGSIFRIGVTQMKKVVTIVAVLTVFLGSVWAKDAPTKDIVETAVAAGQFNTLVKALQAAGLVDTLNGTGPFTVFAPTDAAFAKLPAGTLENLLKPENQEKLKAILLYHVVAGDVTSKQVVKLHSAKTVGGQELTINTMGGKVMVDDATVVKAGVMATNGVIHVIDAVLLPQ
jgi:uncharacterized surface protein with fasciclin (FAS1) repeats